MWPLSLCSRPFNERPHKLLWTLWFYEKVYLTYIVHLCYVFSFCTFFREIIFTKFFVKLISRKFSFWLPTYFLLFRELSECRPLREQYGCENGIGMFFLFAFSPNIWHAFSQYYLIYIWETYFVIFKNYLWIYLLTYINCTFPDIKILSKILLQLNLGLVCIP